MLKHDSGSGNHRARIAVAAIFGVIAIACCMPHAAAAEAAEESEAKKEERETVLQEVQVTGSRIVRKDLQSNSPMVTVEREKLENSTFISIEQALNEMPQFMVGGASLSAATVTDMGTGIGGQGTMNGGNGSGDMFDTVRLPETGGRVGSFTPGAAGVNLRGLGSNRSLTLIDGHRGMPTNASMSVDLNTIPGAAISNIEVITGGASAVYGADALAGVTNIRLRDNFEGIEVRTRGGINEVGDGGEWQASTVMGARLGDGRGSAMIGIEYSNREVAYWRNRDYFVEAMQSPFANAGNLSFQWWPGIDWVGTGTQTNTLQTTAATRCIGTAPNITCQTSSSAAGAGGGALQGGFWTGNRPQQWAVDQVFADRNCPANVLCISAGSENRGSDATTAGTNSAGPPAFYFNSDGSLFTRSSSCTWANPASATAASPASFCGNQPQGITYGYGPQGYTGTIGNNEADPTKVSCSYVANSASTVPGFQDVGCNPTLNRVDYGRWLSAPREAYTLFGRSKYQISDKLTAYATLNFASSETATRREYAPASGTFSAGIPYHSDPNVKYLPSIGANNTTLPEYRVGGVKGTNCPATGGCSMQQAFPVSPDLQLLLNSRPDTTRTGAVSATNPFAGLSVCELRTVDANAGIPGHIVQVPASGGRPAYTVQMDSNTGETFKICGPNSPWRLSRMFNFLPPRGTINQQRTWSLSGGLQGEMPFSDWTWEGYFSTGNSRNNTEYQGLASILNYRKIVSAPNYGKAFREENTNAAKVMECTSGLNPFSDAPVSQNCIDAISSNQLDRSEMYQTVWELSTQGHVLDLPAGEMRAALGATYRKNDFTFTPDSLRERDYVADTSPGQFGVGYIDAGVSVKEVYGELLVPLLRDLPGIQNLELELGGRWSEYSTGQDVPTWKVLASWQPVSWVRARGGYNRAERAPNIAELYTAPTTNTAAVTDPCVAANAAFLPVNSRNSTANPNRQALLDLCSAQINYWGGNNSSTFHNSPTTFGIGGGVTTVLGNPDLESEKGQTWTMGVVLSSPFQHPLARRMSATVDWYEARVEGPIEVIGGGTVAQSCFNAQGQNPTYSLNDPGGFCALMERDPSSGQLLRTTTQYVNNDKLVIRGLDVSLRWSAPLADMGLELPGTLSINVNGNYLIDQLQPLTSAGTTRDYVGYAGASPFRATTGFNYSWSKHRVGITWNYRQGTRQWLIPADNPLAVTADPNQSGYHTTNIFNATAGSQIGPVNASLSISNLLGTKPGRGPYQWVDPTQGIGTFSPFGDLVGRRYSLNLSMNF